jgi:hypothetical protein
MGRPKKNADRHVHKTVSFRFPDALVEQMRVLAKRNRRTLSGEAQMALENHLARYGLPPGDSQPALPHKKKNN